MSVVTVPFDRQADTVRKPASSQDTSHPRRHRLLLMITRAERGGAQSHVLDLACAMRERFEVILATGEEGFLTQACRAASIPVHVLPHLQRDVNPWKDARAWFEVHSLLRQVQPDLLHAHTWKAGLLGRSAAASLGIPCVYTVHMWPFGEGTPALWRAIGPPIERVAAQWGQRLIAVSQSGAEVGRKYRIGPSERIVAIENGIPDCAERAHLSRLESPVIAMVARFREPKDQETLLKAFSTITGARLLLIGDGPTRPSAERLAQELGVGERVEFPGERSDIAQLLTDIDIFVLASKHELLPISILEAMRAGLPVVATNLGGIPQLVEHGVSGFLVERRSVTSLQSALSRLVSDRDLRVAMGGAGRLRYEQKFDSRTMCARTQAVYFDVIAEHQQSRTAPASPVRQRSPQS